MEIIKAIIGHALDMVFNRLWLKPDEAGSILAQSTIEACKDVYPNIFPAYKTMLTIRKDWLEKFNDSFDRKIKEYIQKGD
jgi:hypothetical protein